MSPSTHKKRALLSVSDKTGIVELAKTLIQKDYEIISTGGTQTLLQEHGVEVTGVESVTNFPECFSGRVKTLHPLILGGVLFKREEQSHVDEAKKLGIEPIDIVVVNLYPFASTLQKIGFTIGGEKSLPPEAIEQIDIGGPTLLRSAAKNYDSVTVVCDPMDYTRLMQEIRETGEVSIEKRKSLAAKVFLHTCTYDALIAEAMSGGLADDILLKEGRVLRYGENPHQWGKFFHIHGTGHDAWKQVQGKELSYLNLLDGDAAWRMACEFNRPTAVFVKHMNPSGIASDDDIETAFQKAYDADRLSAFGVIIAINRPCTKIIAEKILEQKIFVEVLLAPTFEDEALRLLAQKPNIRVLLMGDSRFSESTLYRSAFGGIVAQNDDLREITEEDLQCVTEKKPTKKQIADLLFAWKVVKHTKSNAIVLAKNSVTIGIGAGQTSRVDATWIALKRAGTKAKGSVLASDAFFPFPDSLEEAASKGVAAIIQPGGSIRDIEVIARANELQLTMVHTGVRAFRH